MGRRSLALGCALLLAAVLAPTARANLVHIPRGTLALPASLGERTLSGVAIDGAGNLYAGARGSGGNSVAVFGPDGAYIRDFDIGGITAGFGRDGGYHDDQLDLALGPDGLLYVGQPIPNLGAPQDRYISVYTTSGTLVRELEPDPDDAKFWIGDLEIDAAGNIYALVRHNGPGFVTEGPLDEVLRIDPIGGTITARFALTREETGAFETELGGLALAPDGSIWVTTSLDGSRLIHLAADGGRLPSPPLDTIVDLRSRSVEDVDFAGGLLYVAAGRPNGMVAITPEGRLVDRVPGEARQLAIAGTTVYATKLGAAAAGASARGGQCCEEAVARLQAVNARPPDKRSGVAAHRCPGVTGNRADTLVHVQFPARTTSCDLVYINYSTPRCSNGPALRPIKAFVGGRVGTEKMGIAFPPETAIFELDREQVGDGGNVVVEWSCPDDVLESVYEVKGAIDLIDPSGNVVDAKTGRPVEFATVRLQFTPVRGGSFGIPSLSLLRPQVNPQTTGASGAFAWDVAAGFWRLRVSAFAYKPFTSATFKIPPEVTGLKLRLRRSSAYRRLIDPVGRVGDVRVGGRLRQRVRGLRIRLRGGRIREIAVRGRAFRTAAGIRLRSSELDLLRAYPAAKRSGRVRRGARVLRFKRAFFTLRGGRVVAIRLARQ